MPVRLTVGLGAAVEAVSLDTSGEASAFGSSRDLDWVADFKQANVYCLTYLNLRHIVNANLSKVAEVLASLLQVSSLGLLGTTDCFVAQLNALVAIFIRSLYLGYGARPNLNDSHAIRPAVLVEDLRCPYLFSYKSMNWHI